MIEWSHDWFIVTRRPRAWRCFLKRIPCHVGVKKFGGGGEAWNFTLTYAFLSSVPVRLSLPRFLRPTRQCLRLPPLPLRRPRFACPPSLAGARKRSSSLTRSISMRNRHPPTTPDCIRPILAAQGAPDPEAPFLHPIVRLKPDPPSPALHRTPPPQRSLMPNREQKSPPKPKSSPLRRIRNHTTICLEWRQSLIVPAQSSLVGAHSEASLATDGG
jgi:hypothetical protein